MRLTLSVLIVALALTISQSRPAVADWLGLCNDQYACAGYGPPAGFAELSIQHKFTIGTTGSNFTVDLSNSSGITLLGFESPYPHSGQLDGVMSVAYGECKVGNFEVGKVYLVVGCGEFRVAPATAINCSGAGHVAYTDGVGALCTCGVQTRRCFPLATEPATWGKVKALYR